jgi:iron complex outermembrane receptor protein
VAAVFVSAAASANDAGSAAGPGIDRLVAQAKDAQRAFNIPAQSLATALNAFGRQAGIQVSVDAAVARGVQVQGVTGTMTPQQALTQLLAGTGIVAQFTSDRDVLLTRAAPGSGALELDPVQVQGFAVPAQAMIDNIPPPYAGGQVATGGQLGMLGNRDVMDTPFNQTSYTAKKVQDQQAKTVRDALIDDPSVRSFYSDGTTGIDAMYIRGFSVLDSPAFGGLQGIAPYLSVMPEMAERIEVLKGPSAMLFGMPPGGGIGGMVNIVPKRAGPDPLTQFTATYNSASQFGGHVDLARRLGPDKQFGVRMNGVYRAGPTEMQWNTDLRALALLGLDFRGERVRLSADFGYQYQFINGLIPFVALGAAVPLPWAPNARSNPGGQPWSTNERKDTFGVIRGEVDITERITAYASFGAHDYRNGQFGVFNVAVNNFSGTATATPRTQNIYSTWLTGEVGIRGTADTGPIGHEFSVSATTLQQDQGASAVNGTAYATSIYSPSIVARPNLPNPAANKTATSTLSSIAIADTLTAVDKRIQLTVGGRLQQVKSANFNVLTGAQTSTYDQSALTPAVALVFKPWSNVSFYGNFIQGLQQGAVVGAAFANAGEIFPPYKSTQFELGAKVDWGKFTTTASLFQITQPSILTNVSTNTQYLGGEQRNQGLEINVFGEPTEGVRMVGGLMLISAVLTKTQGGLTDGWTAPMAPNVEVRLGGEWDTPFVRGLTLNGRVVYTGSQYIDTTFPRRSLPAWTRFDVGLRYVLDNVESPTGHPVAVRFNVENLFDANYWSGGFGATTLGVGAPRTFRLSLTADF